MNTQLKPDDRDPGQAEPDLDDRPAVDEPHIRLRSGGRSLAIDTGAEPEADDLDVHPEAENSPDRTPTPPTPTRQEGDITGFSEDARRRLRRRLHAMKRSAAGLFVTLTYHEHLPTPEEAHDDVDAFGKWVRRHFPGASITWKQEPQPDRGWPHYHCMITGIEYIPIQRMAAAWHRITEETSHQHRESGVDVEPMVNEDGKLQAYFAKYMAECYDGWTEIYVHRTENLEAAAEWMDHTGRWWGVIGRDVFPWADWDEAAIYLDRHEAQRMIRDLLNEWEVDIPEGVVPPCLHICTRGDPAEWIDTHFPDLRS